MCGSTPLGLMNGLKGDGIAGDKTWNSIYRQKKKKEETDSFLEELKTKSGGWYYDRIQSIRKAQRDLGITPNGKIDNESDSKEDLHEKVRKRWENGGKSTSINPDVWKSLLSGESHKNSVKGENPSLRPKEYNALNGTNIGRKVTEVPAEKEEKRFVGNLQPSKIYEPNEEKSDPHIVTPGFRRQLNEFDSSPEDSRITKYGNSSTTEETDDKEKAKTEEQGIIKPGYNAKGEWSEDPDADNYGKDSAKYKLLTVFDKAYTTATEKENRYAQVAIDVTVDNLRNYNTESITQAYYLIDNQGAAIFGHAGILLVNEDGEGILFSYFRHNEEDGIWNVGSDTRIGIFDAETTEKFLWGATIKTPSSSGDFCTEQYDKGLKYKITPEQGKRILESEIAIAMNNPKYNLFTSNCSQVAQAMLINGGVLQSGGLIPKVTYLKNIIYSDGIIVNGK